MRRLTSKEIERLTITLETLENQVKNYWPKTFIGVWAEAKMFDYDDDTIDIELIYGHQDETGKVEYTESYKVNRETMEVTA